MQSVLFSKYFLDSASNEDREVLRKELLQTTVISKALGNKKYKLGRGPAKEVILSNKTTVIRTFFHGGLFRKFVGNKFPHFHFCKKSDCLKYRPFSELKILEELFAKGISVPKPLAAYVRTSFLNLFYQGAIATEKLENTRNFLEIIKEHNQNPTEILAQQIATLSLEAGRIAQQISALGIFHIDLHLGNILIDQNNKVFIIDFDRAKQLNFGLNLAATNRMKARWLKSCRKYKVEKIAGETFLKGLKNV